MSAHPSIGPPISESLKMVFLFGPSIYIYCFCDSFGKVIFYTGNFLYINKDKIESSNRFFYLHEFGGWSLMSPHF